MRDWTEVAIRAEVMNPGTDEEFTRIFFACECGMTLGSVPLSTILKPRANAWTTEVECFTCRLKKQQDVA